MYVYVDHQILSNVHVQYLLHIYFHPYMYMYIHEHECMLYINININLTRGPLPEYPAAMRRDDDSVTCPSSAESPELTRAPGQCRRAGGRGGGEGTGR